MYLKPVEQSLLSFGVGILVGTSIFYYKAKKYLRIVEEQRRQLSNGIDQVKIDREKIAEREIQLSLKEAELRDILTEKLHYIEETHFFRDENFDCLRSYSNQDCKNDMCQHHKLDRIIYYMNQATSTLDVCQYLFTHFELARVVRDIFKRGVQVRLIVDADMSCECKGSKDTYFRKFAIPIRMRLSRSLMHHKFVVIDKKIVIAGSLNWSQQAFEGNWEFMIITSSPPIVSAFDHEFESLWNEFTKNPESVNCKKTGGLRGEQQVNPRLEKVQDLLKDGDRNRKENFRYSTSFRNGHQRRRKQHTPEGDG